MASFSASQVVLDERGTPLVKRSATTVLLQFCSYAMRPPTERPEQHDEFYNLWMDLDRRGFPVPQVIRGALAPATAYAITARVIGDGADPVRVRIGWWQAAETIGTASAFRARATRYLADLVSTDMGAFLSWKAPDPQVFADLAPLEGIADPVGSWLWERFTKPPHAWSADTKAMEDNPPSSVPQRLLDLPTPTEDDRDTIARTRAEVREMLARQEYEEATSAMSALAIVKPFSPELVEDLAACLDGHDVVMGDMLRRRADSYRRLI